LDIGVIVAALTAIDTRTRCRGAGHASKQQAGAGANTSTLIATDRGPCNRANHGAQRSISHSTVICGLIGADAANLGAGITTAEVVI
jgi:hypothetical protein